MKKRLMTVLIAISLGAASFSAMADFIYTDRDGQIWRCRVEPVNPADPTGPTKTTCEKADSAEPIDP